MASHSRAQAPSAAWKELRVSEKSKARAVDLGGRRGIGSESSTSLPVYHQLYIILRQQIKDGAFPPDAPMPTEMALCARFDVSRVSVRRALEMLEREGLIVRRHGVGTYAAPASAEPASRITGLMDNLVTLGLDTQATLLAFEEAAVLPNVVTSALGLEANARGTRIERLRFYQSKPLSLTNIYLPPQHAALVTPANIEGRPIMQALEAAGLRPLSAEQSLSAVTADDYSAAHLDVPIGAPLIRLRRRVLDREGCAFEFQQGLYNPDQYEYHMLLTRDNSSVTRPQWRHIG